MPDIYLTNTLGRKKEKFVPIAPPVVSIYSCGPTVYLYSHIGHMRRYVGDDILKRVLIQNGYQVKHVMNITDVGHLTSDADTGEDKIEKSARETGKSAWDIAKFFEAQFFASCEPLNIIRPNIVAKATDHIKEQIDLISRIEKNGYTYKTDDGIYFDTSKLPSYGALTGGKAGIKAGIRVELAGKKNPTDFALWKFSPKGEKRQMEWESPWGVGFPGWHIECSAMSMKYLGETFDIHTGGVDHIAIHHTNEIAQSMAASGQEPVRFWIHHEFLQVNGEKMAKSLKNTFTVEDVIKRGFDPLALRYLFLTAHYRDTLNFTWESLASAGNALNRLRSQLISMRESRKRTVLSREKEKKMEEIRAKFMKAVNDDLNTPKAIATMWDMFKSNIPAEDKYDLALSFDDILGLSLNKISSVQLSIPDVVQKLMTDRERLRREGQFSEADKIRVKIEEMGYKLEDTSQGTSIKKI
jgi:cysteinyl-tRNA synthetase